jgi:hypothetical protein
MTQSAVIDNVINSSPLSNSAQLPLLQAQAEQTNLIDRLNTAMKAPQKSPVLNRRLRRAMRPVKAKHQVGQRPRKQRGFGSIALQPVPSSKRRSHQAVHQPRATSGGVASSKPPQTRANRTRKERLRDRSLSELLQQPSFNSIASELCFGSPVADLSMGWDGTLWAIDQNGAPHVYDSVADQWNPHGKGIDAVAVLGNDLYHFQGDEYIKIPSNANQTESVPVKIATTWSNLPDSFKQGVTGAAVENDKLYLLKSGRYVDVNNPTIVKNVSDLTGWGNYPGWEDGIVDAVLSGETVPGDIYQTFLLRNRESGTEIRGVDLTTGTAGYPINLVEYGLWGESIPQDWLQNGIDGAICWQSNPAYYTVYKGPAVAVINSPGLAPLQYLASAYSGWPQAWNPLLAHAPNGRTTNLWAAIKDGNGVVASHDGEQWNLDQGRATYAAVGQDNSVFTVGVDQNTVWQLTNGGGWTQRGTLANGTLSQISVGDINNIWVRDNSNTVHSFDVGNSVFTPNAAIGEAVHMAANYDGTVWHCNADPNAYRFSGGSESQALPVAANTTVSKVASTGFGNAYCLVQGSSSGAEADTGPQIYSYDSPYQFKSSPRYSLVSQKLEQGLGMVFFINRSDTDAQNYKNSVVAIDQQTGQEVWCYDPEWEDVRFTAPVYDPNLELVYVCTAANDPENSQLGGLIWALNARTGQVQWQANQGNTGMMYGIDAPPALSGTQLCFGDRQGYLYMFDTEAALKNNGGLPTWTVRGESGTSNRVATPVIADGCVYFWTWCNVGLDEADGSSAPAKIAVQKYAQADGTECQTLHNLGTTVKNASSLPSLEGAMLAFDSVTLPLGTLSFIYVQALNRICLIYDAPDPQVPLLFQEQNITFTTGLTLSNSVLWVGAVNANQQGRLYGFDLDLKPIEHTPAIPNPLDVSSLVGTPVVYQDTTGGTTVFLTLGVDQPDLYLFNPGNGLFATVPLGNNIYGEGLSRKVTNGVIYVGGMAPIASDPAQVFGIRVDELAAGLHDFIIESQLLQDPDPTAPGGSTDPNNRIPPSFARYQTHLTVVDNHKAPRPNTTVKIWASEINTTLIVNGQSYTAGPNDDQYVLARTDVTGSITIVSDATDLFAAPLMVWANFMDTYERIWIYPDQEFHARMTTAYAGSDTDDDPDKVNLTTVQSYNGTPLFTADENSDGVPKQTANAIQQMSGAIDLSGGSKQTTGQQLIRATQPTNPYIAYDDLLGMSYSPVNVPATRLANITAPAGFKLSKDTQNKPTYASMSAAQAANEIDQLDGIPWQPPGVADSASLGARKLGGWWSEFWNAVKELGAEITHFFVSIGEDIYVGIRYFVNGIAHVFKAIIKTLKDVAAAIGTFFIKLGKIIANIIEALSILFHFDEIKKTHILLRNEINNRLDQFAGCVTDSVIPAVNGFFNQAEERIANFFDDLTNNYVQGQKITDLKGQGATEHTAYTVQPSDGKPATSHSVQCSWAMKKLHNNYKQGSDNSSSVEEVQDMPQDLEDFVTSFTNSLMGNGNLGQSYNKLKSDFSNLFHPSSITDFLTQAVKTLVDTLKLLLEGALAVSQAFIIGVLTVISDMMSQVKAILNNELDIPVLSWLYETLFDEKLTFLNVVTLIAAIPVTIIYKVAYGRYPSQDWQQNPSSTELENRLSVSAAVGKIMGLFGAILSIASGGVSAISDGLGDEAPSIVAKIALGLGICIAGVSLPLVALDHKPDAIEWATWGVGVGIQGLNLLGLPNLKKQSPAKKILDKASSFILCGCSLTLLGLYIAQLVEETHHKFGTDFAIGVSIASAVPGILNPIKIAGEEAAVFVAILDGCFGFALGLLGIIGALQAEQPS